MWVAHIEKKKLKNVSCDKKIPSLSYQLCFYSHYNPTISVDFS